MSTRHDDNLRHAGAQLKGNDSQTDSSSLEPHEIHGLLSNQRRYLVIKELAIAGPLDWHDLRDKLAAHEEDCSVDEVGSAARNRVRASLKQTHFDKLEAAGVIQFDGDTVTLGPAASEVTPYIPEANEPSEESVVETVTSQLSALF